MSRHPRKYRILITAGGTGGHIYPALAMGEFLRQHHDMEVLFVGTLRHMERRLVPEAGFAYEGVPMMGFRRKGGLWGNILLPFMVIRSLFMAWRILSRFSPDAVMGTGGYASFPCVYAATYKGIPTLIHESNAHAGMAHRWLARRVSKICVSYENMERYFSPKKLIYTGTPLRSSLYQLPGVSSARAHFKLDAKKSTLLVWGGSLGARSINEAILASKESWKAPSFSLQLLWITGASYYEEMVEGWGSSRGSWGCILSYVKDMAYAYALADVVLARAGALSIAELVCVCKPSVLVPSPHVVEDHQRKNAEALAEEGAAYCLPDNQLRAHLFPKIWALMRDKEAQLRMKAALQRRKLKRKPAARIAEELLVLISKN